jgi:hypothetical protein
MSTVILVLALFGLMCLIGMLGILIWAMIETLSH